MGKILSSFLPEKNTRDGRLEITDILRGWRQTLNKNTQKKQDHFAKYTKKISSCEVSIYV